MTNFFVCQLDVNVKKKNELLHSFQEYLHLVRRDYLPQNIFYPYASFAHIYIFYLRYSMPGNGEARFEN